MREHEVPPHVQAEDMALLWFTFPQIVAVVATCAVAYGVYRYFPFGPSGLRLGIAILLGVLGVAMTVGKVGRRGLPLVTTDLLKFNLGARRYAGSPAELTVSEPPPEPEARPTPEVGQGYEEEGSVRRGLGGKSGPEEGVASLPAPQLVRQGSTAGRTRATGSSGTRRARRKSPRVKGGDGRGAASWRWRPSACWRWSCCPAAPWPTAPTKATATPGGWTKSTSSRRTRCRAAASTSSGWRSPATPPPPPCGPPTTWT